jgi:hypothetical protein
MKVKAITMSLLALMVSQSVNAKYTLFYPLSDRPLNFVVNGIDGSVSLDKNSINRGQSANIVWNYKYVSKIDIENLGSYSEREGSASVHPLRSTSYDITVYNGEKSKKEKLYLTVNQPEPEISFVADRYTVGVGESVNLSWDVKNIDSAMIDNNIGEIDSRSSIKVTPSDDTTYKLTATGYFGEKNDSKLLTIDVIKNSIVEFLTVNKNKFTVGEEALFNWQVSNSEGLELYPYGKVDKTKNSASVVLTKIGSFDYTLKSTSFNNSVQSSNPVSLNVYGNPVINSFTVNNSKSVNVETGDTIAFNWTADNNEKTQLDGRDVTGNAANLKATTENKIYQLDIINGAGKKVSDSVTVNVVEPVDITTFIAPSNVFANEPFTLSWSGSGVDKYSLSGQSGSGVSSNIDMGVNTSTLVTPTNTGTFTYSLKANNLAEKTSVKDTNVVVESIPTFTGLTVNGQTSITVAPSTLLTFATTGASMGATLKGRNSSGSADLSLPSAANSNEGTTNYYASVNKVLNGVSKYSEIRSVMVTVVNTPTIESITGPNVVFNNSAFTLSWSGTNASNYKIKSNNAASGISTSDMDLSTSTSKSITPTVAGTYNYTITVTNAAGVTATSTKQVVVENLPTFTDFTVNGQQTITVAPSSSLNFIGSGFSTGATLQGRNSAGTANATLPTVASSTAGTTSYYAAAVKTINGVTNYSGIKTVSVVVVDAPTITSVTAPSSVFANAAFTMSWAGSNTVNYTIKSNNAASGISTSEVDLDNTTSKSITPTVAGNYTYTITATNAAGVSTTSTKQVVVEALPTFTGFTVNGSTSITVSPSTTLSFSGAGFSTGSTLQGRDSSGSTNATLPSTASTTAGTTTYYASSVKTLNGVTNYSGLRSVAVTVVNAPTINSVTAPSSVFTDSAFTLSWTGTNAVNYKIKASNATSGISTTDQDVGTATSIVITPTDIGTYTYTITATNSAGVTVTSSKQVVVEALPTFTGFMVNGTASVTVAPSTALNFAGTGFSTGAALQGRNSAGTANATLPTTASATAGTTTYYASAYKTVNGVTNNSAVRSVTVTVVDAPVISAINAPTPVFMNTQFTMSWTATGATNYTIKSDNATSGVATSNTDIGTATSRSITPTAAGTYVYTVTATNSVGVSTSKTVTVVVESLPSFTGFTVNNSTSVNVAPSATLSFVGTGFSTGSILQGRNSAGTTNATLPATASATAGTTVYYASAAKTLNGVTNYSAVKSVSVVVVNAPVISSVTAPSNVFANESFTMSWAGTDIINYKIKSNNVASGISVSDLDVGTATSQIITPTSAGNYTYTLTGTSSTGATVTKTASVSVGNSYLRIVNPQSSSGIYNVTDGKGGTFPVYVDMSMDGGYWLLITRWTSYPSSLAEHTFSNVVVSGQSLLTYTNDTTNYPVVPSGYTNSSTRALFNSANTSWTSVYGQWQSFNLFSNGAVLNSNGFSANTPLGTKTFYAVVTGWAIDGTTSAPMSSVFGLWTAYGNGGACGGATRAAPTKICAAMSNNLQANHLDAVSVKSLYIKASN